MSKTLIIRQFDFCYSYHKYDLYLRIIAPHSATRNNKNEKDQGWFKHMAGRICQRILCPEMGVNKCWSETRHNKSLKCLGAVDLDVESHEVVHIQA